MNDRSQRKDSFFEKEKRGRKKNFPFTEKEFVRVEEFVNSFPNQSEFLSFFFRRFLITSSPLREKSSKREKCLLERGKTRRKKATNVSSQKCHQFHRRRRIRGKEREREGGNRGQNPLREIRVLSRLQASDTNPTQTASLVLTLRHRYDESSIPPSLPPFTKKRDKERERKRDEEKKEKKNGEKSYPLRRILFLGVGGSRLISLNSRETFRGTGGTLRWK